MRSRNRENRVESTPARQTPASLLGLALRHDDDLLHHKKSDDDIGSLNRASTIDSQEEVEQTLQQRRSSPSSQHRSDSSTRRQDLSQPPPNRSSVDTIYSSEQLAKIVRRVDHGKWSRRRSYPFTVFILWLAWLFTFR